MDRKKSYFCYWNIYAIHKKNEKVVNKIKKRKFSFIYKHVNIYQILFVSLRKKMKQKPHIASKLKY